MTAPRHRPPLPPSPPYAAPAPPPGPRPSAPTGAPAGRRRNPARGAKVVALVSSVAATLGVAGALEREDRAGVPSASTRAAPSSSTSSSAGGTTAARSGSGYADGTYTGTAQPTKWGPIQVQATIAGGRIVAVEEVVVPADRKSQNINQQAAPILESEAVAVQSADLDAVSGATWTSRTYTASLQAALDQARASAAAGRTS